MSDYDIFRVKCADGSVFEPVEARMTGQGVVRVWKNGEVSMVLPPSAGCTIERVLPYPPPAPPPDPTIIWVVLGIALALGALMGWAMYRAGFPGGVYFPPACPPPPMPPNPPEGR